MTSPFTIWWILYDVVLKKKEAIRLNPGGLTEAAVIDAGYSCEYARPIIKRRRRIKQQGSLKARKNDR